MPYRRSWRAGWCATRSSRRGSPPRTAPSPTSSSSRRHTVPDAAGGVIGGYSPEKSEEALALERLCVQGISYRLSFRRSTFHRRAENFPEWRIFTARLEGRLVGVAA